MIKTIIFDIGNVLTGFCLPEFIQSKGYDKDMPHVSLMPLSVLPYGTNWIEAYGLTKRL